VSEVQFLEEAAFLAQLHYWIWKSRYLEFGVVEATDCSQRYERQTRDVLVPLRVVGD
jgi:hypothetical protein